MRRALFGAVFVICSLLIGQIPAVAEPAAPGVVGSVFQNALGSWLIKEDGDVYMYFAGAARFATETTQSFKTVAFVDKSKCAVAKTKNLKVIACSGSARAKKIEDSKFQFDPTMSETSVDFDGNHVRWVGQDLPQPSAFPIADPAFGALAFGSVDRWAIPSGRVLGQRFTGKKWSDFGYLSQGIFAGVLINTPTVDVTMDDNGRIHYRFRVEVPAR